LKREVRRWKSEDGRRKTEDKSKEGINEKVPDSPPLGGMGGQNRGSREILRFRKKTED